ncbi:MAG: nitrogen regulation protein NR(II) [Polyangiaceae bacterium]
MTVALKLIRTENALHEMTAQEHARILGALPAAVIGLDAEGTIVLANESAVRVLGRQSEQLVGMHVEDVLVSMDEIRRAAGDACEERATGHASEDSGRVFGFDVTRLEANQRGSAEYAVVFRDITGFEQLREERDRLLRLAAVSDILPSVLHELKNPLAAISTSVELMLEELPEGTTQEDLHAVLTEMRRMKLTLEGLGSVGRSLLGSRNTAVDHALRDAVRVLGAQARSRRIHVVSAIADMPLLPMDISVVRAIAFNLITNAVHACDAGDQINVAGRFDPQTKVFTLRVEDTGQGMKREVLERCTELFYTTKSKGTGIGLALCSGAVRSAGGEFSIRSELGKGTAVQISVTIPERVVPRGPGARRARSH